MCREPRAYTYSATVRGPAPGVRGPDLLPTGVLYFHKLEKLYQKMSSDTFYVVVTEKWAAAVPSTWVLPDVMTVWWPKGEAVTLAASKKQKPESSWSKTTYQYLVGPFDTYIEARKMEKRAICISTDDDTEALLSKFPSDRSKREKKDNKQDDFL
ncbi:uncharacterized protein LOC143905504 [Temnothorax americanus]|uniref:uncharacterized protein LOC143899396 n=1 Tax=Temnothorax americanus TaxID=1964332 RepID=UPI0040695E85